MRRDERPLRRVNPSGKVRWVARYTDQDGKRRTAGTFEKAGPCKKPGRDCCAQHAIWAAYEADQPQEAPPVTVRAYFEGPWLQRHPRRERTQKGYVGRVKGVLSLETTDGAFGDLPLRNVRPRHLDDLVDVLLRNGRAASGTRVVIATIGAMFMDAIRDELAEMNPALLVTVRDNDPRVTRPKRGVTLASWEQMHAFARAAGEHEPMVRVLSDCGLRLGEMLGLECKHVRGDMLIVEQSAWCGVVSLGTKQGAGREVPVPPVLAGMLARVSRDRIGPLFPMRNGRVWHERTFYQSVWYPARERSGLMLRPHDMRHSYVSWLRAAGVDPADLAQAAGHTVQTATSTYAHATGGSFEAIRGAVG